MKIYTRTGDDGSTGLLGSGRVRKDDARVEAYGSVDELNAALGAARAADDQGWVGDEIVAIQARLFALGAELAATTPAALAALECIADDDVTEIENLIDRLEADLAPLTSFILPGGTTLGGALHLARTVCRRAERRVVALQAGATVEPRLVRYLNRLADLLFVMARWCNARTGVPEREWKGRAGG
ncbi:MAG: cob(I)yrinic acid a,c-diamide adenosyltransferase [Candidatus Eisenbacteria bacterium]|nr:cob(I)yrinic acid a,c-diamide adenosyltransferase [Candidatus Eisenbacteria bacterium]